MKRPAEMPHRMPLLVGVMGILLAAGPGVRTAMAQAKQAAPSQPSAAGPSKELPLSMKRALLLTLKNNLQIAVQRFNPSIQATAVDEARAAFDPVASTSMSFSDTVTPSSARTIIFGGPPPDRGRECRFRGRN